MSASGQRTRKSRGRIVAAMGVGALVGIVVLAIVVAVTSPFQKDTPSAANTPPGSTKSPASKKSAATPKSTRSTPTDSSTSKPAQATAQRQDVPCGSGFIVVMTNDPQSTARETVRAAVNRFPDAPNPKYLDPAGSCANLTKLAKAPLQQMPYLGPFKDGAQACQARMKYLETDSYVASTDRSIEWPIFCSCVMDRKTLPYLDSTNAAHFTGDNRFWTSELQEMLIDKGLNPSREVDGRYGPKTAAMVRQLQEGAGLPSTGATDPLTWEQVAMVGCPDPGG